MNIPAPLETIADLVAAHAEKTPAKTALTFVDVTADGGYRTEERSYAQLERNSAALAKRLAALGLRRGDAFALMMANHPEFVEAVVAGAMLGAVFVPIDPNQRTGHAALPRSCIRISARICSTRSNAPWGASVPS